MTALEAAAVNQCVSHMFKRAGVAPYSVVAMESMHSPVYSRGSCKVAAESIWENIKDIIKKIIDWIKSLFTSANKASAKIVERIVDFKNRISTVKNKLKNKKGILLKDKKPTFESSVVSNLIKNDKISSCSEIINVMKDFDKNIIDNILVKYNELIYDSVVDVLHLIDNNKNDLFIERKESLINKLRGLFHQFSRVNGIFDQVAESYEYKIFDNVAVYAIIEEYSIHVSIDYNDDLDVEKHQYNAPILSFDDISKLIKLVEDIDNNKGIIQYNKTLCKKLEVINNLLIKECEKILKELDASNDDHQKRIKTIKFFNQLYSSMFKFTYDVSRYYLGTSKAILEYCNTHLDCYE
jgi:hypothetical protein